MSRKSGIFNFIKLPNLMVGLVAACVFCGDLCADGMMDAYYLYNTPSSSSSSSSSSASTPSAQATANKTNPTKAGNQYGLSDCTVLYGFKDTNVKYRFRPSMMMAAQYQYLATSGAVGSLPNDVIPCRNKIVVISKKCKEAGAGKCDNTYDVWRLNSTGTYRGGTISDIVQCANNQKPSIGTWLDMGQWLVSAESGKTYYVKEGHDFGYPGEDTFFMFSIANWSTDICWVGPSAASTNSSDTGTEAVSCGLHDRKISLITNNEYSVYLCESGVWTDKTDADKSKDTNVQRCTEDWCNPVTGEPSQVCDLSKGVTVSCKKSNNGQVVSKVFKKIGDEYIYTGLRESICRVTCTLKDNTQNDTANTTTPAASSGDCNTPKEKEDRGAVEIKKQGALCVATECKRDHYKVKDASGGYQGWCIYKKCPAGHHVDTGTDGMVLANDTKCVADTPTDTETKVEASGNADAETSAATTAVKTTSDPAPEQETPAPAGPADGEECNKPGARQAEYRNGKCVAMECDDGYEPSGDNCVEISGPCESLPAHAVRGHREYNTDTGDVECIIEDCDDGYVVADDKLSCHEDYDAQAEAAREREQSTGNKLLGAVGMGATGIGGSMLMSGLAESAADDEAERAMKAYLSTFTCKYGNESVSGGTMNVEIPGGNELINMYSEYVALANDLKLRKAALGMKPGIESEPILDSATSGLYDDVGTGRGKGVYASLARALENPDGEDAKAWAVQREESEKKKKTGAIVAGVGAVGSLIGNLAINADWGKNKHKALRDLEEDVNNIQPSRDRCPDDADGTYAPDCDCSGVGRVYNANMNRCDACPSGMIARNNSCECPQANQIYVSGQCVDAGATVGRDNGTGADVVPSLQTAVLSADAMFAYGRYELRREALDALDEFINNLRNVKSSNCKVKVVGYADPSGSDSANLTLSQKRASNVVYYLRQNVDNVILEDEGRGEANCTCGLRSKIEGADTGEKGYVFCKDKADDTIVQNGLRYAPCRRVEIQMQNCELESDVAAALGQGAGEIAGSALGSLTTAVTGQ